MGCDVLIVTKDRMGYEMGRPVRDRLIKGGASVAVVAEGISMNLWDKAGVEIVGGMPAEGCYDPKKFTRTDLDPMRVLDELKPRVVLVEMARPLVLGDEFVDAANEIGIRVGCFEDLWGVSGRTTGRLDFVCALDEFSANLAHEKHPRASVLITGDPSKDRLVGVKPDPEFARMVSGREHVVLCAWQGMGTLPMVQGLVKALAKIPGFVLVPRPHGKYLKAGHEDYPPAFTEVFSLSGGTVILETCPGVEMASLMKSVHYVVGLTSNALIDAAILGTLPVCWDSPEGRANALDSIGVERFPLATFGCGAEVSNADGYLELPDPGTPGYRRYLDTASEKLHPGNATEKVARAIQSYL